jgi:hypothetical protein
VRSSLDKRLEVGFLFVWNAAWQSAVLLTELDVILRLLRAEFS